MTGDVSLLNANFETVSEPIDGYNSFFVDDYYYATGTFELHLPVRYFHAAKNDAEYIFVSNGNDVSGNNICAKIDEVTYKNDNSGLDLVIKGSMLEGILRDRIIDTIYEYNDTVENAVYAVLGQFALTGDRTIPNLELAPKTGYTDVINGVCNVGADLEIWLYEVLKPLEMSYRIDYDFVTEKLVFSLYRGLDRTEGNIDDNTVAIFSETFENLAGISYQIAKRNYKNVCYVEGEFTNVTEQQMVVPLGSGTPSSWNDVQVVTRNIENKQRITVKVDNSAGQPRREMYIQANIDPKSDEMTSGNYAQAMYEQGVEALEQNKLIETVGGEILAQNTTLIYGEDYSLGDLCDVAVPDINVQWESRITQIMIIYENASIRYEPKFGEALIVKPLKY